MKTLGHRLVASTLGAVAVLGSGVSLGVGPVMTASRAVAQQVPAGAGAAAPAPAAPAVPTFPAWTAEHKSPLTFLSPQGIWGEVVSSTSRWIVVQNQDGQQFPISSDRIRQFLVRWPSSVGELTPASMVEATGYRNSGSSVMVDHIDVYEANAQNLVSPTLQNLGGGTADPLGMASPLNAGNFNSINFETLGFGSVDWTSIRDAGTANWTELPAFPTATLLIHVVGRSVGINPVTLTGFGPMSIAVVPGNGGMTVTQVTLGTNSYAKKGDVVHLVPENATARGLDVGQLVLYKKIPLRQFQP